MNLRFLLACAAFSASSGLAHAADPAWWAARGVKNTSASSNLSPATIGQVKHMVAKALEELQNRLPLADYQALESDVAAIVDLALPSTQADFEKQKSVLLVGQVKALAKPFYDRLRVLDIAWVNMRMSQAGIRVLEPVPSKPYNYSPYPWTESTGDDSNKSVATVGQLKAAFVLPLESWITPTSENPALPWGPDDADGDGLSDLTEIALGTSPSLTDTDSDSYPDAVDYYPLDPARWFAPGGSAGDLTGPIITLIEPLGAILIP